MANQVMNFARGKYGYYANPALGLAPANARIVIVVLQAAEADDALNNHDNLQLLLDAAGNTEALSTGYARKSHAAANVTFTVDDTNNDAIATINTDDTWTSVSQAASESWAKLLICYDADNGTGTDTDIIVLSHHDFVVTPNGGDITANYDQVNGVWAST